MVTICIFWHANPISQPAGHVADEVRNDFYLNLYETEFDRGPKKAERNIEAKVFVVDSDGQELVRAVTAWAHRPSIAVPLCVYLLFSWE